VFARRWRRHPFIVIPNVVTDLCRERVLVTEWVDGVSFEEAKAAPQATRDHLGEVILRFFIGSLYRFGQFSGDPHPGNFLLLADGRVAFLDFGMTKTIARDASRRNSGCSAPRSSTTLRGFTRGWLRWGSSIEAIPALIPNACWLMSLP
jgi:predicted unusual protein kinase regulating ubiquinone biosynthesis (AarF/ABC1/UbiB family)